MRKKGYYLHLFLFLALLFFNFFLPQKLTAQASFVTLGNASSSGGDCYVLTPNLLWQNGTAWCNTSINLSQSLTIQYNLNFGTLNANGADGIAFVLQNQGTTVTGGAGVGIGYQGISPSVVVEFDDWQNGFDPANDHVAVTLNGNPDHTAAVNAGNPVVPLSFNIEDGNWHTVQINWNPVTHTLQVYFNCQLKLTFTKDIVATIFGGNSQVWWGFTSATGSATNLQQFCYAPPINITMNAMDVTCNGLNNGSVSATGTGGTSPYGYLWNTGQTTSSIGALTSGNYSVTITDTKGCITTATTAITQPPLLTSTSSQTDVSCNGVCTGVTSVTPAGGTPPYTYNWQPSGGNASSASSLCVGTYTVIVADSKGCTKNQSYTITEPQPLLTPTTSQTNISCNGVNNGSATVNPSGGTPNYTYLWNPSGQTAQTATGLSAGTYTAFLTDANGCIKTTTVNITSNAALSVSVSSTEATCSLSNGTGTANPSGGTPGYTFNWSNGQTAQTATGLSAGTYSTLVTDTNGCTASATIIITAANNPTVTASATSNVFCHGGSNGSASANVSGGSPTFSYQWNNGQTTQTATGLTAGSYSVSITDANGCIAQSTVIISQPSSLSFSLSGNDSICVGDTVTLNITSSGGTPAYTYMWIPGSQSGQSILVSPTTSTTYSVITIDKNGCTGLQTCIVPVLPSPAALFDTASNGMYSSVFAFSNLSTGGASWFWNFGNGSTSTQQNPVHTFPGAGTYTVSQIVFNPFGCPDTFEMVININEGILIPNVFTPDGDGINDVFYIPNSGMKDFYIEIFDRWGEKVFETNSDEIRWDGYSTSGILLSDGTYYYVLKALLQSAGGEKNYHLQGYITLLTKKR